MTMNRRAARAAVLLISMILSVILTGCSGSDKTENSEKAVTKDITSQEKADADLEQDSETEEAQVKEPRASTDLFFEEGAVCTQYLRLTEPEEWRDHVTYHYFQEAESGRYAIDVFESESMTATEGIGGALFSIAAYEKYPEERGMDNASYLGLLKNDDGRFFYVFLERFPGTQYTEGTEEVYAAAEKSAESIAGNLEGRNGFTFEPGSDPAQPEKE